MYEELEDESELENLRRIYRKRAEAMAGAQDGMALPRFVGGAIDAYGAGQAGEAQAAAILSGRPIQSIKTPSASSAVDSAILARRQKALDDSGMLKTLEDIARRKREAMAAVQRQDLDREAKERYYDSQIANSAAMMGLRKEQLQGMLEQRIGDRTLKEKDLESRALQRAAELEAKALKEEKDLAERIRHNKAIEENAKIKAIAKQAKPGVVSGGQGKFYVPGIGNALTATDAKELKDSKILKEKLDRQIDEMISLREKFGGEIANRGAVARGKQLSKDLLLTYKNLSKLGVLSKSDEDIVNSIIPEDPLEFNLSSIGYGTDPVLAKLKGFRADTEDDFKNNIAARISGKTEYAGQNLERPVFTKQRAVAKTKPQNVLDIEKKYGVTYEFNQSVGKWQKAK